jgi:hypothetical protein
MIKIDADSFGMNDVRAVGMQLKMLTGTYDFSNSYPTGGEVFDLSNYFSKGVIAVDIFSKGGYVFEYDKANKKVIAYHCNYDAVADGPLVEVANGTNLSAVTGVSFIAYGF